MNKNPYIGKGLNSGSIVLFYEQSKGVTLESKTWARENLQHSNCINEDLFTNITREYLANTKVEIESEEHRKFILNLAKVNGLYCFRLVGDNFIYITNKENGNVFNPKLITLPLPPKEAAMSKAQVNVNNNTDSIVQVTKSDDESNIFIHVNDLPKDSGEWPQVGDEVLIDSNKHLSELGNFNGEKCKVIGVCDHKGEKVLTLSHSSLGVTAIIMGEWIKKPPTPEEELAKALIEKYKHLSKTEQVYAIASDIVSNQISKLM